MAMASSSSSRHRFLLAHRRLCSSSVTQSPAPISIAVAKTRLRREFDPDKAISILSSVADPESSPVSGRYAVGLAVRRLARSHRFNDIESLLESRKKGPFASQEKFLATIILSYGEACMVNHAVRTFDGVPTLCSTSPTTVSFNALLSACIRGKHPRRVPYLFAEMSQKHSIIPDAFSYGILIKSLCLSGQSIKAFEKLKEMEDRKIDITTVIYTTLLDSLYKDGKLEEAEKLWSEMPIKGCDPDLITYNVRIAHRALHGMPQEVLEVVSEIEAAGLKPDTITFNYLITSYCKDGRFADAKEIYKRLKESGRGPNATTFKNLLHYCCENGDFDSGLEVYRDSVQKDKIPGFQTMSLLVGGLVNGSRVEEAKEVIGVVKKRFPKNLVERWIVLEKKLGLNADEEVPDQHETTCGSNANEGVSIQLEDTCVSNADEEVSGQVHAS